MKQEKKQDPSGEYIRFICGLYGDAYDDREEDSRFGGRNWEPGVRAGHRSIAVFQKELAEAHGIRLSRVKIQKILITGGCWSTERSREVGEMFGELTAAEEEGGRGMEPAEAVRRIAEHLGISGVSVSINLPYARPVYDLEEKSENARRIERCRARKKKGGF